MTHPPFEKGNQVAVKHGMSSEARVVPLARNQRRRVLRQLKLSPKDLDPIGRGYLDSYCRLVAKIDLIDKYVAEHGLIKADGNPQPVLALYVSLANSARLALVRLEDHLRKSKRDPATVLAAYLSEADDAKEA